MRRRDTDIYMKLLDGVKERIANGSAKPSVAVRGLEKQQEWGLNEVELAYACSAPWQAGTSTVCFVFSVEYEILIEYFLCRQLKPSTCFCVRSVSFLEIP
jgi:hypothetical protein